MQMVDLPEKLLSMSHDFETKEAIGLDLGVGSSLLTNGNTSAGVGGEPLTWGLASGGYVRGEAASQLASTMSLVRCSVLSHKTVESSGSQEPKEMVENIKEEAELWRIEGMEGVQDMDESHMPEPVTVEEEKWGGTPESESMKVQDWCKHDGASGQPKASENRLDSNCEVPYQDLTTTSQKGSVLLGGCTKYTESAATNDMDDAVTFAKRRKSHGQTVVSGGDSRVLSIIYDLAATIKACADRCLSFLVQDLQMKVCPSFEQAVLVKGCIDALGHNAKSMLATAECLEFLQKSSKCSRCTERLEIGLPALVSQDEMVRLEGKAGSPSLTFLSEACSQAPFSSTKLGLHQVTRCAVNRDHSLNGQKRKRKRTRFTFEQLRKLNDFATRTGWTLAGVCKGDIDALCVDVGIEPMTLKYWIHNTRQKSRKKLELETKSPTRTP